MCPSRRVVGLQLQSAEGVSNEAEFPPRRGLAEGSVEGASGKAEIACASRGLGGKPSSEAKFASRLVRPRKSHTVVLGCGPSVYFGPFTPGEDLGIQTQVMALF